MEVEAQVIAELITLKDLLKEFPVAFTKKDGVMGQRWICRRTPRYITK